MQERINELEKLKQKYPHLSFAIDCRILEIEREYLKLNNKIGNTD